MSLELLGFTPTDPYHPSTKLNVDGKTADAAIKAAYENNADTNAFTDAEQTKLASIGGSSPTIYDATIGATGADYETLGAAVAAGKVRLLLIDNTTETADIALPFYFICHGIGKDKVGINMGNFRFTSALISNFENLKIIFAFTSSKNLFTNPSSLILRNFIFDNNSTASFCQCISHTNASSEAPTMDNVTFDLPNFNNCGVEIRGGTSTTVGKLPYGKNIVVKGGGTGCGWCFEPYNGAIDGIEFRGTFNGGANLTLRSSSQAVISKLTAKADILCQFDIGTVFSDFQSVGGAINIQGSGFRASNIDTIGTILIFGDDTTIVGAKVGADAGGGSNTITINAGSDRTIISACRTDAAIVDNGTGTITGTNVIF